MFSLDVFAPYPSTKSETTLWRASREIWKSSFSLSETLNPAIACGLLLCPYWPFWLYLKVGASTGVLGHYDSGFWGAVASLLWNLEPWHDTQTCWSVLISISANHADLYILSSHQQELVSVQCLNENINMTIHSPFYQSLLGGGVCLCQGELNKTGFPLSRLCWSWLCNGFSDSSPWIILSKSYF